MKKVLVFGTFDIFHEGHRDFLQQAIKCGLPADAGRGQGVFLRVVVARDATVTKVKKRQPLHAETERQKAVAESGLADEVVLGSLVDKYAVIEEFRPDVICLGYDQKFFIEELKSKLQEFDLIKTKIIRLQPHQPQKYKSSILREKMK